MDNKTNSPKVKKTTTTTPTTNNSNNNGQPSPSLWANLIYKVNTQSRQLMRERISLSSSPSSQKSQNNSNGASLPSSPIPMWNKNNNDNNNDSYDSNDYGGGSEFEEDDHSSIPTESMSGSPTLSSTILNETTTPPTPYSSRLKKIIENKIDNSIDSSESESESEYNEDEDCSDTTSYISDDFNDSNMFSRDDSDIESEKETDKESETNTTTSTTTTRPIINRKLRKPRRSLSSRSGLVFPVSRVHSIIKANKFFQTKRISKDSCVFLTAVLQYLCEELLILSIGHCNDRNKKRIGGRDILKCMELDNEFRLLFDNLIVNSDTF